jgi:MFS family permease
VLTLLFVPESRAPHARKLDPVGQLIIIVLLVSLTYAIIEGPSSGWGSAKIVGFFALAAAALAALIIYEPRRDEPLLDLRFFRSAPFSGATVIAVSAFAALSGFLFINTLYLQDVRRYTPLHAGLYMLPMAVMTVIFAPLSGRIVGARGTRLPLTVAGVAITVSALMLTRLTATTSMDWVIAAYVIFGLGFGMVNAPITNTAVSGMPRSQAGVAAGIASTSRQVGGSLGVAVVGSAVLSALAGPLRLGFADASHAGWWIIAGCGVAVLLVGLLTSGRWARATAERTASRLMPAASRVPVTAPGAGPGPEEADQDLSPTRT